jgi:hypothetical protein
MATHSMRRDFLMSTAVLEGAFISQEGTVHAGELPGIAAEGDHGLMM